MLTIDHLEKRFGSTVLFRDLTFTVDGPAVLWAPSGWGKTTLLRILMGRSDRQDCAPQDLCGSGYLWCYPAHRRYAGF